MFVFKVFVKKKKNCKKPTKKKKHNQNEAKQWKCYHHY